MPCTEFVPSRGMTGATLSEACSFPHLVEYLARRDVTSYTYMVALGPIPPHVTLVPGGGIIGQPYAPREWL